jgi:hypothetical protein
MVQPQEFSEQDCEKMRARIPVLCKLLKAECVTQENAKVLLPKIKECKELYLLQIRIYARRLGWLS